MNLTKFRSLFMSCFGMRYRELPFDVRREEIEAALSELNAQKCSESGSPAYEVNNEVFRIGRRKLRLCTEDEMLVSLWGSKALVDNVHQRILGKVERRTP